MEFFSCILFLRFVVFFQGIRSRGPGDGDSELDNIIPSTRALAETDALPFWCRAAHAAPPGYPSLSVRNAEYHPPPHELVRIDHPKSSRTEQLNRRYQRPLVRKDRKERPAVDPGSLCALCELCGELFGFIPGHFPRLERESDPAWEWCGDSPLWYSVAKLFLDVDAPQRGSPLPAGR